MNKTELIDLISNKVSKEIKKTHIKEIVECYGDVVLDVIKENGEIYLPGVVKMGVKRMPSKKGKNPRTGEVIDIPEKNKVYAKVSQKVKDAVE